MESTKGKEDYDVSFVLTLFEQNYVKEKIKSTEIKRPDLVEIVKKGNVLFCHSPFMNYDAQKSMGQINKLSVWIDLTFGRDKNAALPEDALLIPSTVKFNSSFKSQTVTPIDAKNPMFEGLFENIEKGYRLVGVFSTVVDNSLDKMFSEESSTFNVELLLSKNSNIKSEDIEYAVYPLREKVVTQQKGTSVVQLSSVNWQKTSEALLTQGWRILSINTLYTPNVIISTMDGGTSHFVNHLIVLERPKNSTTPYDLFIVNVPLPIRSTMQTSDMKIINRQEFLKVLKDSSSKGWQLFMLKTGATDIQSNQITLNALLYFQKKRD